MTVIAPHQILGIYEPSSQNGSCQLDLRQRTFIDGSQESMLTSLTTVLVSTARMQVDLL